MCYIILVCIDLQITSFEHRKKSLRWSLGPCSSIGDYKYFRPSQYTERCCLAPGKNILTCSTSDFSLGWKDAKIDIEGHSYCDDFMSLKAIREVMISGMSLT